MPIETDLNQSPYYDDYSEDKNFHRILFRPAVPVQARELTQLQTILQNQVERFGENIYTEGTILKGCNFVTDDKLNYIKLPDLRVDGQPTQPSQYVDYKIVDAATGLSAIVIDSADGFESQNPDMKTLYIKYQNTGTGEKKTFSPTDVLTVYPVDSNTEVTAYSVRVAPATINAVNTNPVGNSYSFKVTEGIIFQKGAFIRVANNIQVIVSKYSSSPNNVVAGFKTLETIVQEYQDDSLLDNASGYSNENAPGAHRLKLTPTLVTANSDALPSNNFFSLIQWDSGNIIKTNQQTEFSTLGRELARRTSEESGDYVVKPFTLSTEATSNSSHLNIVTSSGLAFVDGYRVERLNNTRIPLRKGTDIVTARDQSLFANYGNYILVKEYVGSFASNIGGTVSLRDTAATNISDGSFSVASGAGSQIGTAKVLAVTLDSGTPGDPSCVYRVYLTDIKMNSSRTFGDVRSLFYSGSANGVADAILTSNTATLVDSNFSSLVFKTAKTAVKSIRDGANNNNQYVYRTIVSSTIANTGKLEYLSRSAPERFPYGTGRLNSSQEARVIVIPTSTANVTLTSNGTVSVANATTLTVTGVSTNFLDQYEVRDFFTTNAQTRQIVAIANQTSMTVDRVYSGAVVSNTHAKTYPAGVPIPISARQSSIEMANSSQMAIYLYSKAGVYETLSSPLNVVVHYDVQVSGAPEIAKTLKANQYVKIDTALLATGSPGFISCNTTSNTVTGTNTGNFNAHIIPGHTLQAANGLLIGTVSTITNATSLNLTSNAAAVLITNSYTFSANGSVGNKGPWCLGLPDVFSVNAVYRTTTNAWSTELSSENATNEFVLDTGQKDGLYDLAYLKLRSGSGLTLTNGDKLLVKLNTFVQGAGDGYFSIDSYPIDDANTANTAAIRTVDLPSYTTSTGKSLDLRDCIDFRPYVSNTAIYANTANVASVNPANTSSFPGTDLSLVSPDTEFEYDIQSYVGRVDKLVLNSLGSIETVEGIPSENPQPGPATVGAMTLGQVTVPPYPTLSTAENASKQRDDYTVKIRTTQNRRYTMRDIANLDKRVSSLEYYTSLNLLEAQTKDLVLKSDINGADRFKNGFFVDPFNDFSLTNTTDTEFSAALDPVETSIIPKFNSFNFGLQYASANNAARNGSVVTIDYDVAYGAIDQPYATRSRNVTETVWNYQGQGQLFPGYDSYVETRLRPVSVSSGSSNIPSTPPIGDQINNDALVIADITSTGVTPPVTPAPAPPALPQFINGLNVDFFPNVSWPGSDYTGPPIASARENDGIYYPNQSVQSFRNTLNSKFYINAINTPPVRGSTYSPLVMKWSGRIKFSEAGNWTFNVGHDGWMCLYISATQVAGYSSDSGFRTDSGVYNVTNVNWYHDFALFYCCNGVNLSGITIEWVSPSGVTQTIPASALFVDPTLANAAGGQVFVSSTPQTTSEIVPYVLDDSSDWAFRKGWLDDPNLGVN